MINHKFWNLISIISILVCITLATCTCGSEPIPTSASNNTILVASIPTVTVPATSTAIPSTFGQITTVALTNTVMPTAKIIPTIAPSVANSIENNWLKGIPCRAPCWENITPGKTSPDEALKLLKKVPGIINPRIGGSKPGSNISGIEWDTLQGSTSSGFLFYHNQPSIPLIEAIKPEIQPYRLKDVFSLYGEPSHIIAVNGFQEGTQPPPYHVFLIYMAQGLILSNTSYNIPVLTPDTEFTETYFFIPGLQGFKLIEVENNVRIDDQGNLRGDVMVEWQGFKDFKFYCRRGDAKKGITNCK